MHLFDSNILIYHLNDALPPGVLGKVERWITEGALISVITRIEVMGYPQAETQRRQASRLLSLFDEVALQGPVVERTIDVRRRHRIRLPDAVIAATALVYGASLITRNRRDFQSIDGLQVIDPFSG
ncbi:MAG: ribonuclease VapC [Rhodothermaceae bacterium]|nr:MAG: type II toxin-antitoxin system VapC family toxin [Bacteroidota bacterium]GIV62016.1 MAG: ribonuclease VapC [Rhodothermaceae bacterium]